MSKYLEGNQNTLSNSDKKDLNENDIIKTRNYFSTNGSESEYDHSQETNTQSSYVYDLFAVCNHKGQNMANGHYTGKIFLNRRYFFLIIILFKTEIEKSLLQKLN